MPLLGQGLQLFNEQFSTLWNKTFLEPEKLTKKLIIFTFLLKIYRKINATILYALCYQFQHVGNYNFCLDTFLHDEMLVIFGLKSHGNNHLFKFSVSLSPKLYIPLLCMVYVTSCSMLVFIISVWAHSTLWNVAYFGPEKSLKHRCSCFSSNISMCKFFLWHL